MVTNCWHVANFDAGMDNMQDFVHTAADHCRYMAVSSYLLGNMSSFLSGWQEQLFPHHLNNTAGGLIGTHMGDHLAAATTRHRERASMKQRQAVNL